MLHMQHIVFLKAPFLVLYISYYINIADLFNDLICNIVMYSHDTNL